MIKLGDLIKVVKKINNIYIRVSDSKAAMSFIEFVKLNPSWSLYNISHIISDYNDLILDVTINN